jgi:hypothetical protein
MRGVAAVVLVTALRSAALADSSTPVASPGEFEQHLLEAGVVCESTPTEWRCTVSRAVVAYVQSRDLSFEYRLRPETINGTTIGQRILEFDDSFEGRLFRRLLFRVGDVIQSINRVSTTDEDKHLEATLKVIRARVLTVKLLRDNHPLEATIRIDRPRASPTKH